MTTETPIRRRWFQFRLRTLLIAIVLLSLPLSWFGARLRKARRQKAAMEVVGELGGLVIRSPSGMPRFVVLGEYNFRTSISGVAQTGGQPFPPGYPFREATCIRDGDLAVLTLLVTLEGLGIHCTDVSDAGLTHLQGLTRLKHLDLTDTQVTPEGVKKLQEALPNCEIEY